MNSSAAKGRAEKSSSRSDGGDIAGVRERLAILETHKEYAATKQDIQGIKIWILCGVIAGMIIATTLGIAIAKLIT